MEVILIKDVPGLGFQDEKVIVKDGYGRNYLIPQGFCVLANKSNSKILDEKGFEIDKRNITLSSKVNSTGEYTIFIKLHKDVTHEITLNVTGTNIKKKTKVSKKKKEDISDESVKNPEEKITEKEKSSTKKDNKKEETVKDKSESKEDPEKKS